MSLINPRSITRIGIGFGALAISSLGFIGNVNEVKEEVFNPIQVYTTGYAGEQKGYEQKSEERQSIETDNKSQEVKQADISLNNAASISKAFDFIDSANELSNSNINQEKLLDTISLNSAQQQKQLHQELQLVNENVHPVTIPEITKVTNVNIVSDVIDNQEQINSDVNLVGIENIIYKSQDQNIDTEQDLEAILLSMMTLNIL